MRYGHLKPYLATFLASVDSLTSLLFSLPISAITSSGVLHYLTLPRLRHGFPLPCFNYPSVSSLHLSGSRWYRNLYRLSIIYAFRPRLRSRLTLGGRTFPRKPQTFDGGVSRSALATYAGILSSIQSTTPSGIASARIHCSSTNTLRYS